MTPDPWRPPPVQPPATLTEPLPTAPRARWIRWLSAVGALFVAIVLVAFKPWGSQEPEWASWGHLDLRALGAHLVLMAVTWSLMPKVSYRRRDVLLLLVPYYQLWVVAVLGWRLSALPYRDWPPRDDERHLVRLVPGTQLYVLAEDDEA